MNLVGREGAGEERWGEVTVLLRQMGDGDRDALEEVIPLVYQDLRRIAHRQLGSGEQELRTTALVHDAYLRLAAQPDFAYESRRHFFAVAAKAMRRLLIDLARRRASQKRGGDGVKLSFDEALDHPVGPSSRAEQLLDLDRALEKLGTENARLLQVVECRFFAGLSVEETAEALGVSLRTIKRDWLKARVWLELQLR